MSSLNLPGNPLTPTASSPAPSITGLSTVNPLTEAKPQQMQRRQRTALESKNGWWWGTGRRKHTSMHRCCTSTEATGVAAHTLPG